MDWENCELRTKRSVRAGIMYVARSSSKVYIVDYQPGNGTSYLIQIVTIKDNNTASMLGLGSSSSPNPNHALGWIISRINGPGSSMVLSSTSYSLYPEYVMEKMNEQPADAYVIAEFIAHYCKLKFKGIDKAV